MKKCTNASGYNKNHTKPNLNTKVVRQGSSAQAFKGIKPGHPANKNTGKGNGKDDG